MPTIYFRTDGNEEIATGHIMRCLSVARACTAFQATCCFLVADETSLSLLQERFTNPDEFSVQCLHSDYKNLEAELPVLQSILSSTEENWLFIDSYYVTEKYLSNLQKFCRTAYLDDILAFDYPVDMVINYDMETKEASSRYRKAARKLLGASYTPLRKQFQNVSYEVRPEVKNILISTGGTDTYNAAGKILNRIFTEKDNTLLQNCQYHVITSRLNSHFQELEQTASHNAAVHIHENVQDMAVLMAECDLALSAGGTTLYELCAVGVPSISFATADNQLNAVETFAKKHIVPYAGDIRFSSDNVLKNIADFLYKNIRSYKKRQGSSQRMRAFIDGNGSSRIAAAFFANTDK